MRSFSVIVALLLAVTAAAVELPEALKELEPAFGSPETLIPALRDLEKKQNKIAAEIIKEAGGLVGASNGLLAEAATLEKNDDIKGAEAKRAEAQTKKLQAEAKASEAREATDLARMAYEAALEKYQDNAEIHNFYGELLYDGYQDEPGGLREWHKAISLDSKLSNPYNNLGIHYFHMGSYPLGLENLDKALELEPENPDYNYNMAQMYAVYFPQVEEIRGWKPKKIYREMMKHSETAIKSSANDYELLKDYAMNYFLAEKFGVDADWGKAAVAWQAAQAAAPNDDEKFSSLLSEARSWISAEKQHNAVAPLEQALVIHPDSEVAKNILETARQSK